MALITSKTVITSISLFHITIAYFLLTNPRTVEDQILVYILGEAMNLPSARGFDSPSPALAFTAVILFLFGLSDLVSLSMPEELGALYYWGTQAPIRFTFSMCLVFYSYAFGPSSPLFASTRGAGSTRNLHFFGGSGASASDGLKNRLIFTFMFLEMATWFWIWITLREERAGVVDRLRKQHARRED